MSVLLVRVFGITKGRGEELAASLRSIDDVSSVAFRDSMDGIMPGVIYASVPHLTFLVEVATFVGGALGKEIVKDVYGLAKKQIQEQLSTWKDGKDEGRRQRIQFQVLDKGDLGNRGW